MRQVPVSHGEPRAVAEHARHAAEVAPLEWRRGFIGVHGVDDELLARRVRVRDANVREECVRIRPAIRLRGTFTREPDLVILPRHVRANRAVLARTMKRVVSMPRDREPEAAPIANVDGVQDHEIAKAALRALRLRLAPADLEQAAVVPLPVLVLAKHDCRMLELHAAEVEAPVHEVTGIVAERHLARGHEQRILVVAQLERIDGHAGEEAPADPPDVHLAVDRRLHARLHRVAHRRLAILRLRREHGNADDDRPERHEHAQADEGDEVPARHGRGGRLRNPGRWRRSLSGG